MGAALTNKMLNKWGVRNILLSPWKDLGEVEVKWVRENTFLITVQDESTLCRILNQVPWAVMKQNFFVQRWPPELALKEIQMELVPFWIQIRGVPLSLYIEMNVRRLAKELGDFLELEDPMKAREFLRVRVVVNSRISLVPGCWIPRNNNRDTWIEFQYERLQDFCYCCGRIGHDNTDCSFLLGRGNAAAYGNWTRTAPVRDEVEVPRPLAVNVGKWRLARAIRGRSGLSSERRVRTTKGMESEASLGYSRAPSLQEVAHSSKRG